MMSPRERVLNAINHRRTDRMPADYQSLDEVTNRLMARLGMSDVEELLQYLRIDMRRIWFWHYLPNSAPDAEGYQRDMWGVDHHPDKKPDDPQKFRFPFDEHTTVDEIYAHPWPSPDDVDYRGITEQCDRYYDEYATYGCAWPPFFHEVGRIIGQENQLMWMHLHPEIIDAVTDCVVKFDLEVSRRFLEACHGKLDVMYVGNDFGTQRGLYISPQSFDRFVRPWLKKFFDLGHDYGCKVMQHSCGSVRGIIPWLIEDGVDILNPIQVQATGMAFDTLVRDFGQQLTFHGGVDTQFTLPAGAIDDVRAEVRSYRDVTRDGGGYILCSSQELMADIPDDNILAMYDAPRE